MVDTKDLKEDVVELISPATFYLKKGLYEVYKIDVSNDKSMINALNILHYEGTMDAYCQDCKKESTFQSIPNLPAVNHMVGGRPIYASSIIAINPREYFTKRKIIIKELQCSRDSQHVLSFVFLSDDFQITKVGQTPALADFSNYKIEKYRKLLGDEFYKELHRGIGIFSHGVGIGAFVYLRRIIENYIIKDAHDKAKDSPGWDEEGFQQKRIKERMSLLKNYLPEFFTKNTNIYSILSKGLHELSEGECNKIFPILQESLEYIMDEIISKKNLEKKKTTIAQKLSDINNKIK